ncbi:MAG TPA: aminoglycoside phosphotransferase family protein [Candidatus Saccharimonadales bacterium]|nr:aminoglycoside phosphotransferase family protein [Candidatus Saccharimonadales bacterium]
MSTEQGRSRLPPQNLGAVERFVAQSLGSGDFALEPFASLGYQTTVYACETATGEYIVRHGHSATNMAKDRYAAEHFARPDLPIPRVVAVGRLADKTSLCLSERAPGGVADAASLATTGTGLNRQFNEVLQAIHTTDVSGSRGYAYAKGNGQGALPSWLQALGLRNAGYRYWARLAGNAATLDQNEFKEIAALQRNLGGFALTTEERRLCHGDPKDSNLIAAPDRLTVIDWSRFEYGDPAYDLGILHVRHPGAVDPAAHAEAIGLTDTHLTERTLYYALGECLVAMGYFGQEGLETEVAATQERLVAIAHEASSIG